MSRLFISLLVALPLFGCGNDSATKDGNVFSSNPIAPAYEVGPGAHRGQGLDAEEKSDSVKQMNKTLREAGIDPDKEITSDDFRKMLLGN